MYECRANEIWRRIAKTPNFAGIKCNATYIDYAVFVISFVNGIYDEIRDGQAINQAAIIVKTIPEPTELVN